MKVAIPQWQGRVSPVFDVADKVLLFEIGHGREPQREAVFITRDEPMQRARSLQGLGAQVLICGAISRPMEMALIAAGIEVIPYTCGKVEEVLKAFLRGRLNDKAFLMPGCDIRRRNIRIHHRRDRRQ